MHIGVLAGTGHNGAERGRRCGSDKCTGKAPGSATGTIRRLRPRDDRVRADHGIRVLRTRKRVRFHPGDADAHRLPGNLPRERFLSGRQLRDWIMCALQFERGISAR